MKYITIEDKQYPVHFGMGALMMFEKATDKNALQLLQNVGQMSITDMVTMVFCAIANGFQKEKRPVDFTVDDVAEWVDNDPGIFDKVFAEANHALELPKKKVAIPAGKE